MANTRGTTREVGHGGRQVFQLEVQFPVRIAGEHQGFFQGRHFQTPASRLFHFGYRPGGNLPVGIGLDKPGPRIQGANFRQAEGRKRVLGAIGESLPHVRGANETIVMEQDELLIPGNGQIRLPQVGAGFQPPTGRQKGILRCKAAGPAMCDVGDHHGIQIKTNVSEWQSSRKNSSIAELPPVWQDIDFGIHSISG